MAEGTLIVNAKKQIRVRFKNSKDKEVEMAVPDAELSHQLKQEPAEKLNGRKVELDEFGGQPKKVRSVGEPFAAAPMQPTRPIQQRGQQGRGQQRGQHRSQAQPQLAQQRLVVGAFHNPYNFVPALPRDQVTGAMGDCEPLGHHVLHADHYTGVIRVRLTVQTPLLLPDAARAVEDEHGHKSFPVRVDADGKPYIAPTSIKGMLRAAYEAVMNSRLTVFAGHEDRLADRMPARDGLSLVPARVVLVDGVETLELLQGTSDIGPSGRPAAGHPMYAAWLPRYHAQTGQIASFAVRYPNCDLPQHGDIVGVGLELWERGGSHPFRYWKVRACVRDGQPLGDPQPLGQPRGQHRPVDGVQMISVRGRVCVTNRNIDRKHDERVFFVDHQDGPLHLPLTDEMRHQWCELITNYQTIHEEEIARGMTSPPALNGSVWSRQVDGGVGERALTPGTLCYAAFHEGVVTALYPVMISRRLFESSPLSVLSESLRPATSLTQLSPADRVFGWVNQQGKGAYRGNLRVGPVTCESDDAIESFGNPGLPLAILGQPKPQQARFYVAKSQHGEAQDNGITKDQAGYSDEKGLRGRKVYPHHRGLPTDHWNQPMTDRTQQANDGHFQEYRRPQLNEQEQRDNQNRSIQGWVKPDTVFTFDLHVTNLSNVELGALLWLLSLPADGFHRFGGGKPLGFGSVRLEISSTQLRVGNEWRQVYSTLDDITPIEADHAALIDEYKQAARTSYGPVGSFEDVPFIAAWLRMATGHADSLPTHYPRARQQGQGHSVPPHPEGQAYEWFVANDRTGQNAGPQASLPDLATDSGLPTLPE